MCDNKANIKDLLNDEDGSECNSVESFATANSYQKKMEKSPLLPHESISLEKKLKRIIVIRQIDQSYHMALRDMVDQPIISLLVEPNFYGRHCRTSVIVVATANNTYVFDIMAIGAICPEFFKLLQSQCPRKVMHYSHRICDLLWHQHKLKIAGILDTFVALCIVQEDCNNIALPVAISETFNIPLTELTCPELNGSSESERSFAVRPLSKNQVQYLGKIAILQQKLHDRLIYENICKDFCQMSTNLSEEFYKNNNSAEVALNMHPNSKSGYACINPYSKIVVNID